MKMTENGIDESDNVTEFVGQLAEDFDTGEGDRAMERILSDANEDLVQWSCLEIYHILGQKLLDGTLKSKDETAWNSAQSILEYLSKVCKAREVLIGLLDLLEQTKSDEFFHLVVPLVKIALIRLPNKRGETLLWALNSIYSFISSLPTPPNNQLASEEAAILENCPVMLRLEECLHTVLDFCDPFVSEATICSQMPTKLRKAQALNLVSFLLKILEFPVSHFDVSCDTKKYESIYFKCAARIVRMIGTLVPDTFHKLVEYHTNGQLSMSCELSDGGHASQAKITKLSLAVLAYLIWNRGIEIESVPCVRSHVYNMEIVLPFSIALLKKSYRDSFLHKGVSLTNTLISPVASQENHCTWSREALAVSYRRDLYLGLINAMLTCGVQTVRQEALETLKDSLKILDSQGQIAVIRMVFAKVGPDASEPDPAWPLGNGSGVRGWFIDYFRGQLQPPDMKLDPIQSQIIQERLDIYESSLPPMMNLFFGLKSGAASDILENFEQHMATMNLIRFLCLNWTQGKLPVRPELAKKIQCEYLDVVQRALDLSISHYKLELKQTKESIHLKSSSKEVMDGEKMHMLNTALNSFDLLRSLLARNMELMEIV